MPGLDLRQVENVVDQHQKIVARRIDGARELDLLLGQPLFGIVGEQFRQDQQRVERGAQLVAHIGKEIGLVLARLFELARLQLQRGGGAFQVVALRFQRLRLLLELAVGLFELDLLQLEPCLGFAQRIALFLKLLVRDAQLLALRLQLAGLALRLLERILQPRAEPGGPQRDADRSARLFEQLEHQLVDGIEKAELDHAIDAVVGLGRCDHQVARDVAAQRRTDRKIALWNIVEHDQPAIDRCLAEQALVQREADRYVRPLGDAEHARAVEAAAFALEQRTGAAAGLVGEEGKDGGRKILDRLVAHHRGRKIDLSLLQPLLPFALAHAAYHQQEDGDGQRDAAGAGHHRADHGGVRGGGHLVDVGLPLAQFLARHAGNLRADRVHRRLATVRIHGRQCRSEALVAPQSDRRIEFAQLLLHIAFELRDIVFLHGIALHHRFQHGELGARQRGAFDIGLEIGLAPGQQIAALPGLRVERRGQHVVERIEHRMRLADRGIAGAHIGDVEIGDPCAEHEEHDARDQPGDRPSVGLAAGAEDIAVGLHGRGSR